MSYCVGILLTDGIVLAPDSRTHAPRTHALAHARTHALAHARTHAGVDNFATFCKMTVFERPGDRVLILLSSGNLAGTHAVISVLKSRCDIVDGTPNLSTASTMFDAVGLVADAVRDIERRDAPF